MQALDKTAPHQLQAKTQYKKVENESVTTFSKGELNETEKLKVIV